MEEEKKKTRSEKSTIINQFEELSKISVNGHTEDKNGLTYLSWTWAWSEIKKIYPEATYTIKKFENNLPYVYDENTGYMVFTEMTINDLTYEMWLPVMDGNNKAMLNHEYNYQVKEYKDGAWTGNYTNKKVEKATMFDINKTIMRCLVKNIAMFGLGIYIYAGEDYPEGYEITQEEAEKKVVGFGKYKGKTLKEIKEENENYLYWLIDSDMANEGLKNACSVLVKPITQEDLNKEVNRNELLIKFQDLVDKTNTDFDKILKNYQVDEEKDLTIENLQDAIRIMEKKLK